MHSASPPPDATLDQARQGDEVAGRTLVERLHPLVMKIVRAHLPRRASEEDLAQDIYARIFQRLPQYQPRSGIPFEHWVARLATRTCLDVLRSERRRPEWRCADLSEGELAWFESLVDDRPDTQPTLAAEAASARSLVDRLLDALAPEDRLVLRCLDLEGMTTAQVSAWTGWSAVGVRVRAFRARTRLRQLVEKLELTLEDCR